MKPPSAGGWWQARAAWLVVATLLAMLGLASHSRAAELSVGGYEVVSTVRVGRLLEEFALKAAVTNPGEAVSSVFGTVTSSSADTVIIVSSLSFGDVAAGETKTSGNTFTIRQNRRVVFDPADLNWQIATDVPVFTAAITSPADGLLSTTSSVHVTGTLSGPADSVKVNLVAGSVAGTTFSADVPLTEGANTLTVVATAPDGKIATASVNVSRDTEKPRVAIDSPADGVTVTSDRISVTGIFNDTVIGTVNSQQGSVTVNGRVATVANRTFLVTGVPLVPGANTITATGTDRAGNVGTASITVNYNAVVTARIAVASGDGQSGRIGTLLPQPLVALVSDASGAPVADAEVIFKVFQNDGLLTGSGRTARSVIVRSGAGGRAVAPFQLGTRVGVGNNQVQATALGFEGAASFAASATPAPAALLVLDSGNRQSGISGQPLPKPLVAIVVDSGNNRLGNVPITFTSVEGGGNFGGLSVKTVKTDSDGRALVNLTLGSGFGVENHRVEANFPGNTGLPVSFTATCMMPGDPAETSISGVVLDNSDIPVPGATISIAGTALSTRSDDQGQFLIRPAPVGTVRLDVDGTTVTRPGSWVNLDYTLTTVAGHDNGIGMPVRLLEIDTANGVGVGLNYGGDIVLPEFPGFSLKLLPGSVTFPGGSKVGTVTATVVHLDKTPEVPNFGQQPRFIVSINPKRCVFNPPAQLCIPNLEGLVPGQKTEMYSFDDDLDAFVAIGTGTCNTDGTQICSDPGVGVIKGGWHCGGNPAETAAGITSTVSLDTSEVTICKGGTKTVTATGRPTPPHSPTSFEWDTGGASVTLGSLSGPSSTSMILGSEIGEFTARVRYRCKSAQWSSWNSIEIQVIDLRINGPSSVCAGSSTQYQAATSMQSVAVTWGGAVSSSGVLEAPAGAIEGETLTITATIEDCVVSKVISITDGTPGEQSEGAFCLRNPLNCLTEGLGQATGFGGVSLEAEEWASTNRDALGGGISSGCADAARHTYWNALLALEYSQEFAKGLTDAHEYSNIQNGCLDNAMDIHNNGVGRDIAQRLGPDATRQQIQQAVVDALKNGDLVSTLGGSNVPTGSCNVTYTP